MSIACTADAILVFHERRLCGKMVQVPDVMSPFLEVFDRNGHYLNNVATLDDGFALLRRLI